MANVFVLEDDPARHRVFREHQMDEDRLTIITSAQEAITHLQDHVYDLIFLDHDLREEHYGPAEHDDATTGYAVAKWLADNPTKSEGAPVVIHSFNPVGAKRMFDTLHDANRLAYLVPFNQVALHLRMLAERRRNATN